MIVSSPYERIAGRVEMLERRGGSKVGEELWDLESRRGQ